jgi:hypothetical protein
MVMREVGSDFVDVLRTLYHPRNMPEQKTQAELDRLRDFILRRSIDRVTQLRDSETEWSERTAAQCLLTCELTEAEQASLNRMRWSYYWRHFQTPARGSRRD